MGRPTEEAIIKAIKGTGGVIFQIAKKLGVEWHTAKTYINLTDATKQAYLNEEETILDVADSSLYRAVQNREPWAIKWLQSTKGKIRGYIEKQIIEQTTEIKDKRLDLSKLSADELRFLERITNKAGDKS